MLNSSKCFCVPNKQVRFYRRSSFAFFTSEAEITNGSITPKLLYPSSTNSFIALNSEGDIIGFAAFNVSEKEGYFGPMGVAIGNRSEGIGYSLLHHCLKDMKMLGYKEIIIGGAGPIEFYERACSARVVPNGQ